MKEKEFTLILDRKKHEADVRQHFAKHIDLLVDLANYGSNLIPRAYDSSAKKLEDIIVIGILLKQVVSMIDAVELLISKGAVGPANLQARSAFEASLYIDWILKGESSNKAKYYYVSNLRNQRLWALRLKTGTKEKEAFLQGFRDIKKYVKVADWNRVEEEANEELKKIDALLSKPEWVEINKKFEQKNKKTGAEAYWYRLLGVSSIRQLAKDVGRVGEYDLFYSRGSEIMHVTSYKDHLRFGRGTISFEPIRQLKDIHIVLRFITLVAIPCFVSIIRRYRDGELQSFARKYAQDWKDAFLNIPTVSYIS
jgi:ribosomal protein S19E (S16A)